MELLRRASLLVLLVSILPFMLGNKGCEEMETWEHPEVARTDDCSDCHEGMTRETRPEWHDSAWMREHGKKIEQFGMRNMNNCTICHTQSTCNECHKQMAPRSHNQFFRLRGHGLQVGLDRTRCQSCHTVDFCRRCHQNTQPRDHRAGFGAPRNNHCMSCHYPLSSVGAQRCATCHLSTPSHENSPRQPNNALHGPNADCRGCHFPLRHPDNGMSCQFCHPK